MMQFDSKKLGFFYQSAKNPCAVEMNLRQIKKYYPESPVTVWEDISSDYEEICKKYNVFYKKMYRLPHNSHYSQSLPITELASGLHFLHRIYVSLVTEMKDVEWFVHMEDDVWIHGIIKNFPEIGWGGGSGFPCGGSIISRKSFIDSYLKLQEINWVEACADDNPNCRYTDRLISFIMSCNNMPWTRLENEWCQGGYEDYIIYEKPIIHNIKYWYNKKIEDLDEVNQQDAVKFFLANHQ